jgi:hypothetical protein
MLIAACNRRHETKPPLAIYSAYGLEQASPEVERLKTALEGLPMYSKFKDKLDFSSTELYTSKENILIYMIKFLGNPNKMYSVRGIIAKTLVINDELLYSGKMNDARNGTIGILKNGEALAIDFKNGQRIIRSISENEFRVEFSNNLSLGGFCQRKKGQSFGECYKNEADEFCDSFISCLAINTQPQVHIVIALACSCDAIIEKGHDIPLWKDSIRLEVPDTSVLHIDSL